MSDSSSVYQISTKMGRLLMVFVLILVALNVTLIKQNRDLKTILNAQANRPEDLQPGTVVPTLEGKDLSGNTVAISYGVDYRKTLLLSFSPQCGFCEKNMPNWEAIIKGVDKYAFRVAAVSLNSAGTKEYITRHGFEDMLLITEIKAENKNAYKLRVTPQTILIDASGKVEKVWSGLIRGEMRKEIEQSLGVKLPTESKVAELLRPKKLTSFL